MLVLLYSASHQTAALCVLIVNALTSHQYIELPVSLITPSLLIHLYICTVYTIIDMLTQIGARPQFHAVGIEMDTDVVDRMNKDNYFSMRYLIGTAQKPRASNVIEYQICTMDEVRAFTIAVALQLCVS
jgi:hypothetical protein